MLAIWEGVKKDGCVDAFKLILVFLAYGSVWVWNLVSDIKGGT
jgi:hypothetical protein